MVRRAARGPLAAEQLDVADDFHARRPGLGHRPVRLGMGEGYAGRQHEGGEATPVCLSEVFNVEAGRLRRFPAARRVVSRYYGRAAGTQRAAGGQPRAAEAEDGNVWRANVVTGVIPAVYPESPRAPNAAVAHRRPERERRGA